MGPTNFRHAGQREAGNAESRSHGDAVNDKIGAPEASSNILWIVGTILIFLVAMPMLQTRAQSPSPALLQEPMLAPQTQSNRRALSQLDGKNNGWRRRRQRQHKQRQHKRVAAAAAMLVHTHVVPQGGSLSIECASGTFVRAVRFASFGTPIKHDNGSIVIDPQCHSARSERVVANACVGESHCCLPVGTDNFRDDPCRGTVKTLAVTLEGCDEVTEYTRYKRHCSLMGQPLLCDEDIEFLTSLDLPPAPAPLLPHVAIMVDTSYRPNLQHFVVHNVRNHTGWHLQLFHGPSNGDKLRALFADLVADRAITFTDLGSDYMEDWQRLSSMMLIDTFWESVVGSKALVFQPDSAMCARVSEEQAPRPLEPRASCAVTPCAPFLRTFSAPPTLAPRAFDLLGARPLRNASATTRSMTTSALRWRDRGG